LAAVRGQISCLNILNITLGYHVFLFFCSFVVHVLNLGHEYSDLRFQSFVDGAADALLVLEIIDVFLLLLDL